MLYACEASGACIYIYIGKTLIYPHEVVTDLQFNHQCFNFVNCTPLSFKNFQSTPFRPIEPSEETEVDPREWHMRFFVQS
jgi:hypothetical protein